MTRRRRNPINPITQQIINIALLLGAGYIAYKFVSDQFGSGIQTGITSVLDTVMPDANVAVQAQATTIKAAEQAAGYPRVGSDNYNAIMLRFNRPDLVVTNSLTGQGGN